MTSFQNKTSNAQALLDQLPIGLLVLNPEQTIVTANPYAVHLLGIEPTRLVGQNWRRYLIPRYREMLQAHLDRLQDKTVVEPLEWIVLSTQKIPIPVEIRVTPLNDGPSFGGCLLTMLDLRSRYKAEEHSQGQQAELAHAYRLLMLGEVTRGLAHEINQPLAAVLNYTNGGIRKLRNGQLPTDMAQNLLEQIGTQAQRAANVIRRLRTVLQREPLDRKPCEVNGLVSEAITLTQINVRRCRTQVRTALSRSLPTVSADPLPIIQVLVNLILNALESMEQDPSLPPRLVISTRYSDPGHVEVAFHDNSSRTAEEMTAIMTDPLFLTEHSSLRMGLSVTRAVIEGHGGRLWATRNLHRGITVRLSLPCTSEDQ